MSGGSEMEMSRGDIGKFIHKNIDGDTGQCRVNKDRTESRGGGRGRGTVATEKRFHLNDGFVLGLRAVALVGGSERVGGDTIGFVLAPVDLLAADEVGGGFLGAVHLK